MHIRTYTQIYKTIDLRIFNTSSCLGDQCLTFLGFSVFLVCKSISLFMVMEDVNDGYNATLSTMLVPFIDRF